MLYEKFETLEKVRDRGPLFLREDGGETKYSFSELIAKAREVLGHLQARGLGRGDRVGIIVPDSEQFILTFLGAVMGGIIPVPMYPPSVPGKTDFYLWSSRKILEASKAKALVAQRSLMPLIERLFDRPDCLKSLLMSEELQTPVGVEAKFVELTPEDTCFLQFTSGSTAAPKGVIVSHDNVAANAHAMLGEALAVDPESDIGVSWLPLYHDMGLVGTVLAALLHEVPVVYMPTVSFIKNPRIWMATVTKYRGTITFGPNFAFALAAKRADEKHVRELELSCLRVVGCGAEPINIEVLRRFQQAFAPAQLDPRAILPCYGMAEATLAISFHRSKTPLRCERIEGGARTSESLTDPLRPSDGVTFPEVVSCGTSFPGHEIAIVSPSGERLSDGNVGEIVFRGPSVTQGYCDNPEATRQTYRNGWLHTGDLGFMCEGELFVAGRSKDMIIMNGRNYFPQDVEWAVETVNGIRQGCVVAFGIQNMGTEKLVVVAETRHRSSLPDLECEVREAILSAVGIHLAEAVFIPAGTLPKTTSGKVQRQKTKIAYQQRTLGRTQIAESAAERAPSESPHRILEHQPTVCQATTGIEQS
jgi:fatty-acyl-CoA synthase